MPFPIHGARQHGHTLTELIMTMVIVVILTLLAYPSYQTIILQGRRAEAKSALHATLLQQERYYTSHNIYFAFDFSTANSPFKWWSGDSIANSYYEIRADRCPNRSLHECVLLTAIPGTENVRSNLDPVCGNLMLDSTGVKSYSAGAEPDSRCW